MAGNPDIGGGKLIPGRSVFASMIHTLKSARIEHAMGGISGGVVSTLVLHPLDLIKIRFAGKNIIMTFIALLLLSSHAFVLQWMTGKQPTGLPTATFDMLSSPFTYRKALKGFKKV